MVGTTTCRDPNGIILHKGWKRGDRPDDIIVQIFLTEGECEELVKTIQEAKRKYWKVKTEAVKKEAEGQ